MNFLMKNDRNKRRPSFGRRFISTVFPDVCPCCGEGIRCSENVCQACSEKLSRIEPPFCPYCGVAADDCRCRGVPRAYEQPISPFYYEGPVREAVLRMKYGSHEAAGKFLADAIAKELDARLFGTEIDIVTCVPMSAEHMAERGFNQSRSIASFIMKQKAACAPLAHASQDFYLLAKNPEHESATQHFLSGAGRQSNAFGSFIVPDPELVKGRTILIVDDIITTGATLSECAVVLGLHGAEKVYVCAAAMSRFKDTEPETFE